MVVGLVCLVALGDFVMRAAAKGLARYVVIGQARPTSTAKTKHSLPRCNFTVTTTFKLDDTK